MILSPPRWNIAAGLGSYSRLKGPEVAEYESYRESLPHRRSSEIPLFHIEPPFTDGFEDVRTLILLDSCHFIAFFDASVQ